MKRLISRCVLRLLTMVSVIFMSASLWPAYGADYVFDDLTPVEIRGIYRELRSYKANAGPVSRTLTGGGATTTSQFDITYLNPGTLTGDAIRTTAWTANGRLTGIFILKKLTALSFGNVETAVSGTSTKFTANQDVYFTWEPSTNRLYITIFKPGSGSSGPDTIKGFFTMTGVSTKTVSNSGSKTSWTFTQNGLNLNFQKSTSNTISTMTLKIDGNPMTLVHGNLWLSRFGGTAPNYGDMNLQFGQDLVLQGSVATTRAISVNTATCTTAFNYWRDPTPADPFNNDQVVSNTTNTSDCSLSVNNLFTNVTFNATPMSDSEGPLGQRTRVIFHVHRVDPIKTESRMLVSSWTQWNMSVTGGADFGGFDIGTTTNGTLVPPASNPYYAFTSF